MNWSSNHDASLDRLRQVQGSLTVDLIMVARDDFTTCKVEETAAGIKRRNTSGFSFFPVVDENDHVIGLYNAERWFDAEAPDTPVGDDFARLSEDIVIGADASVFEFMMQADRNPTNLVVSGNRIAGLVSLSDLQRLPVRASLFTLITSLEMAMALAIETRWPNPADWMKFLSEGRRQHLLGLVRQAKERDVFVSEIAFTQFCDKADIIRKGELLNQTSNALKQTFHRIGKLRDNVAHANQYAATPDAAAAVCKDVGKVYKIKSDLMDKIIAMMELARRRDIASASDDPAH